MQEEVVKPALRLLNAKQYAGVQQEFLKAHEHYRHDDFKEAMTECAKSLESLLKAICDKRKWTYDPNAPAKRLIEICFKQRLIPEFWEGHFGALRGLLESGVPTARNKLAAHRQGATPTTPPDYLVAFMLHMTASTIVFLAEAEGAL